MNKPNLLRVASELASYGDASWPVANALMQVLAASMETKPPAPLPAPEGQTNNARFNALLNNCEKPRAVYNTLLAFSEQGKEAKV